MASKTTYLSNALLNAVYRNTAFPTIAGVYVGLIFANRGYWAASTTVAAGDWISPTTANGHFYKCTTAGTTGTTQPTWPTAVGSTVTDGTAVWTEQTAAALAGTLPEVSGGSYARVSAPPADWNAPSSQQVSNNTQLNFPAPTANWGLITGVCTYDASTAGNCLYFNNLSTPKTVNNGDPAPYIPVSSETTSET